MKQNFAHHHRRMNIDEINNKITTDNHPSVEQGNNSTQNHPHSGDDIQVANEVKQPRNTSTSLKYSCWSRHRTATTVCAFVLFTSIAIIVGVLTIYFTSRQIIHKSRLNFKSTAEDPIDYNYGPRSVAVGDFNNDTWLDMVVANQMANNISVYLGYSNSTFASPIKYSTGSDSAPYMVVVGHFNNDFRLDIAVANYDTNSIGIFLGFGNGSFANQKETSTNSSRPVSITTADFNNDTLLDIVTADYGTHSVSVYYGYGNGIFASPIRYSTGYDSFPSSIAIGDFNNDNYLDLVIANYGTDNIGILLANGNSGFSNQIIYQSVSGSHPISLVVGHFDNDIFLDIAVANYGTNNIGVYRGNGKGTFVDEIIYSLDSASPYSIGVGDFNLDNRLDLIVTNKGTDNIAVLLGNGDSTFENPKMYETGAFSSTSFATSDFNKDNRLDVAVANRGSNNVSILLVYVNIFFVNQTVLETMDGSQPRSFVITDFNNDGEMDIGVAEYGTRSIGIFLGYGNISFANQMTYSTGSDSSPHFIAAGDFNSDGSMDIVVGNIDFDNVGIFLGYGNGSFTQQTMYSTLAQSSPRSIVVADLNNDHLLDIAVANYGTNTLGVFIGHGNGTFAAIVLFPMKYGSQPFSIVVGDFNDDRKLDFAVANNGTDNVNIFLQTC